MTCLVDHESDDDNDESDLDHDECIDSDRDSDKYCKEHQALDLNTVNLSQHKSFPLCHHALEDKKKKTDQQMKDFIYEMTLEDIMRCSCSMSNTSTGCKVNNGNCISRVRLCDVDKLRKEFWGSYLS